MRARFLLPAVTIAVLIAVIGFALQRELAPKPASRPVAATPAVPDRIPLGAEEEAFAAALEPIHGTVKLQAVRMSFAGVVYLTEDHDPRRLDAALRPLTESFRNAAARTRALAAPESMREVRDRYLAALALYEKASVEMAETARDGRDDHLIAAQAMSQRAAQDLLRVGDVLWPGEYKPN